MDDSLENYFDALSFGIYSSQEITELKKSIMTIQPKEENIQVAAGDMEAKLTELSRMYGVDPSTMVKELYKNVNLIQSLTQQIKI